jgi:ribosomal protein S24E
MSARWVTARAAFGEQQLLLRAHACTHLSLPASSLQTELKEKLASMYDAKDTQCIFLFGFRTQVGAHSLLRPSASRR